MRDECILRHSRKTTLSTDAEIEGRALGAFFSDYCLTPQNRLLSRGYLEGLETLISHPKPTPNLLAATKVVALANIGTRCDRPVLLEKARVMYSDMLHSLQMMISQTTPSNTAELLMISVLLGLYEVNNPHYIYNSKVILLTRTKIITATTTHPSNHSSHSHGVYAILATESSPLGLLQTTHEFQISNPLRIRVSRRVSACSS